MEGSESQNVLAGLPEAAMFVTFVVPPGGEEQVLEVLAGLGGRRRSVGFRAPEDGLSCVVGIGSQLWDRLYDGPRPAHLHPFVPVDGDVHRAPATPGDLLLHIRARRMDLCFELAHRAVDDLAGAATVVDEVHGFRYFDMRDLLGFVDGTENPEGAEAVSAALVGSEDPAFAGGSYVITQKYVHDLAAWEAIGVAEQERAIGRSKADDIEMADDVKPSNSHVALNTLPDAEGNEPDIVRFNMAFGAVGTAEYGTFFIGYAKDPAVTEQLLVNMFVGSPPGNHDRILDFSTALTGNLFFVPPSSWLDDPGSKPHNAVAVDPGAARGPHDGGAGPADGAGAPGDGSAGMGDGSLGIGSLRQLDT